VSIRWHSPRPWSAAAIVDTRGGPLFVKRHDRRVRDDAALAAEHAFVEHLRRNDFPTPAIMGARRDGPWRYEISALAPGEDRYRDRHSWTPYLSTAQAHGAGAFLARLHDAAAGYDVPAVPGPRPLSNPLRLLHCSDLVSAIQRFVAAHPAVAAFVDRHPWDADLAAVLAAHHERVQPYLLTEQPLWGHGDWHGTNLSWIGETPGAAIDFGLADRTCAAFDVATALERATIGWLDLVHGREPAIAFDQVDALLAGYAGAREIDTAAVAAFLPLVHVELALSELDYFTRIVRRPADAELAYNYLVDHARWFAGPGRTLLDHVSRH
jgi:Ser/Thr protein kinase RdoA (MazF antagonist)